MINKPLVIAGTERMIGWRPSRETDLWLPDIMTHTDSGMYYQDEHPLITLANCKAIAPDKVIYPLWAATPEGDSVQYSAGDCVTRNGKDYKYVCTPPEGQDKTNQDPETQSGTPDWKRFSDFSEWLNQKVQAAIFKAFVSWTEKQKTPELMNGKQLYHGLQYPAQNIQVSDKVRGIEIGHFYESAIVARIESIGIQLKEAQDLIVYLYHSNHSGAVASMTARHKGGRVMQWFDVPGGWELPNVRDEQQAGGYWYVTIQDADILGAANSLIGKELNINNPCLCDPYDYHIFNLWSKFITVRPFSATVQTIDVEGSPVFVQDENSDSVLPWQVNRSEGTNQGMNLSVSLYCDYTQILLRQRDTFRDVISKTVACDLLREMAYNPNAQINRGQSNIRPEMVLYELDGDTKSPEPNGLTHRLQHAKKKVSIDLKGIDPICVPCNKPGIYHRVV
ncbi:MAG: hypothetical protein ACOYMF_05995 [Bacteroidales bacterium]